MMCKLFLNKPENVFTKVQVHRNSNIGTQIEHMNKILLSDLNGFNKATLKLNKILKGILLCNI